MAKKRASKEDRRKAREYEQQGIDAYEGWSIDEAVKHFTAASRLIPDEPEYLLQLARALARSGDFDKALRALADFIRLEPESPLADRFEQLFASGMDQVEQLLTEKMTTAELPIEEIGSAIQMWLEYRISLGREPLVVRKPETWAAALDYTIRKVNLRPVKRKRIAAFYSVSDASVRDRHNDLVELLDVMPCDYRYFVGKNNPLDKLVEAAELLEQLEARFREN
jgi:tetratricopeptide (TPR) repeat protein